MLRAVVKSTTSSFVDTCIQPHPLMKQIASVPSGVTAVSRFVSVITRPYISVQTAPSGCIRVPAPFSTCATGKGHEMLQITMICVDKKDKDCVCGQTAAYQLALVQPWLLVLQMVLPAGQVLLSMLPVDSAPKIGRYVKTVPGVLVCP